MTFDELNSFILNYIEKDVTGRAIMLTGEWGSGKSYYIKNTLKPFLENKNNGKHKCVIVSLYGLSDVSEISKAIYMELRSFKFKKKHEALTTAGVAASVVPKTVFNAMTCFIGYDIGQVSNEQLQKVYDSINLNKKLLVLEDIERTQIDIINLLGYINNMCENDGVKVLLVTNENEILHFHFEERKVKEYGREKTISEKIYSEKAQKYIKAKEKTISDTLQFCADSQQTIDSIIDKFENEDLSTFKGSIKALRHSIFSPDITNYREVIVACQKTCDIYNYMRAYSISADEEFKKCILIGLIFYLQKRIDNHDLKFKANTTFDADLSGKENYPLMRFCYDYYNYQTISQEEIIKTIEEYKDYIIYIDKTSPDDNDLKVLSVPYISSESDLNTAINNIYRRLDDINDIGLIHYDRIINYLLFLKYDAHLNNENIDNIISKIIDNLKGRGDKFARKNFLFTSTITIYDTDGAKEFEEIKKKVFDSLAYTPEVSFVTDSDGCAETIDKISSDNVRKYNPNKLLETIPLNKIISYISEYTTKTMNDLRYILLNMNCNELNDVNLISIQTFRHGIEELLKQNDTNLDCIQKLQLKWICETIDRRYHIQ